ncbi:MAG TPA: GNAT family N-acetyltransferase [Smithella sp.]|nr:GNAT family N-acetyltransferase [Smithella sp.]MDM7987445.1 GNAT family N-acetyltransferase [Smithella sp.]HNY50223.1 GNAT family N-acetyltransferase [Smithella sp.]HOG89851.1 GNAT family N-acetyltransferase [Smithella sp.]HOU50446.1 GNAT family N-acetyltransferase [Smithella sp.]
MDKEDEYLIEQFNLEKSQYGQLVELINTAFINDNPAEGGTIAFTEQSFNLIFGSPIIQSDFFVRAIHKPTGKIVGFLGGIPRPLSVHGKIYLCGVPAWLVTFPRHQRKGLAVRMGLKLMEIGKERGYQAGFGFYEPEAHGIDTARSIVRQTGIPMRELATIRQFIIRVFDIKQIVKAIKLKGYEKLAFRLLQGLQKMNNPRVRLFRPEDAERMFELMQDHVKRNEISIVRDHDDFIWYVNQPGVNCVVHEGEDGQVDGFILAWEMQLAGFGNLVPLGWLDLVHTYRLPLKEATDLAKYLCLTARERGWAGLQSPFIPYFDPKPFKKSKFVFFPKKLGIALFPVTEIDVPEHPRSFYFDWR